MTAAVRSREVAEGYEAIAAWFDANRIKSLIEREYLSVILGRAAKDGSVLDLGCGSGEPLARFFIEHGFTVTGMDIAPSMVALCRQRFPQHRWMVGDMRQAKLDGKFGVILAWDSFFHLDQAAQRGMFPLFRDHAAPGALLAFTAGPESGEVYGTMEGREFYHASLGTEEYQKLLADNGFSVILHKIEDPDCGGRTVWLAQKSTE